MNRIGFRTKIEAVIAISVLLILIISFSGSSLTRVISNDSDNVVTFIRNSKGNLWEATSENIQLAIDDLDSSGGTVYLPAGTIYVDGYIQMKNNTKLQGTGKYVTILKNIGTDYWDGSIMAIDCENVEIRDLTVHGNNSYTGGGMTQDAYGIGFVHVDNVTVENVRVIGTTSNALHFSERDSSTATDYDYGAKNIFVHNYEAHDINKTGVYPHGIVLDEVYGGELSDINISYCGGAGIDMNPSAQISLNNINIRGEGKMNQGFKILACDDIQINNLRIDDPVGNALKLQTSLSNSQMSNVKITNCYSNGIYFDAAVTNCIFTNIYVHSDTTGDGHPVRIDNAGSHNITFSNFELIDSPGNGIDFAGGKDIRFITGKIENPDTHGCWLRNFENVMFSNVQFEGDDRGNSGILFTQGHDLQIDNCDFYGFQDRGIYGTNDGTVPHNFTITGNTIEGSNKAIEIYSSCNYFIISNNLCRTGDTIDINAATSSNRICSSDNNIGSIVTS